MNKLQIFLHLPLKIGIFTENSVCFRNLARRRGSEECRAAVAAQPPLCTQKGEALASPLDYIYMMMGKTIGLRLVLE